MKLQERLDALPAEVREPAVAFAAAALVGPMLIVMVALLVGQSATSSPLYTLAAIVFVGSVCGFVVTTYRAARVQRARNEQEAAAHAEHVELLRAQRRATRRNPTPR